MESRSQMSVLLVDDEREVLLLFSMLLKRKFATCHVATNGEEALEILKSGAQIDCVITDISMPRMDGFELKINMDRLGYNIPVIGVTGHSEPEVIQRMKDLGFSHIMLKPVDKGIYGAEHNPIKQFWIKEHARLSNKKNIFGL